jgi:cyclopropane-fatty-acyl-phospholipid synthase
MGIVEGVLGRVMKRGVLTVRYADGSERRFGRPDPAFEDVTVRFADRGVPGAIARDLRLGAAEAFMDGRLVIEQGDILALLTLMRGNAPWSKSTALKIPNPLRRAVSRTSGRLSRLNWQRRSRRNVAHHYDLGNDFYRLFLDPDLQYSCAYFTDAGNSLEQAQLDKKAHIAAKLALRPGQRVLDIGCGWGGMALYLNRVAGVEVLGITLSEEQLAVARERAEAAGERAIIL